MTGTWTATGALNTARAYHTATLLPSGKLLVVGGTNSAGVYLASAELYDPATGLWTATGALTSARHEHTAMLLPNGKVLVTGGSNGATELSSAELYDPATGLWTATGTLNTRRTSHTAALLSNGKVLAAGGYYYNTGRWLASAELYDPASGTWTATAALSTARCWHTATFLPNGKVLAAGGSGSSGVLASAELYDVGLGFSTSWQPQITSFPSPFSLGTSLALSGSGFRGVSEGSGGGYQDSPTDYPLVQLRSVEGAQTLFLPPTSWSSNSFTSAPVTNFPPGYALATVFANGIPSTGAVLDITVPVPTAITLVGAGRLTNGSFQFAFTNTPGVSFSVLAATNPALSLSNWTVLGGVTEVSPGQFQFADPQATNFSRRFYRVRSA